MKDELLYEQIIKEIRRKIESGEILPGDKAPSIAVIRREFHVSPVTAVRALKELTASGYLEKLPGRGYFAAERKDGSLKKSAKPGVVILVGDADMLFDSFCIRQGNFLGQTIAQPINDNLNFALNMIDQLSGDENLFEIRARGTASRPFTVVRDLQVAAEKEFQGKIVQLEEELRGVQTQINELQRQRKPGEKELLSSEQRKVLSDFRKKEVEARKELKLVRRQLRAEIDSLENTLIFMNIALMPILVIVAGITVAAVKRRRSAHR